MIRCSNGLGEYFNDRGFVARRDAIPESHEEDFEDCPLKAAPSIFDSMTPDQRSRVFGSVEGETSGFVLPADSAARKELPIFSGVLNYFPLAIAAVARLSKRGNDKHNPGEPLHWSRDKSTDHPDCIARHLIDIETVNADGEYEDATALAWRALAKLQELEEKRLNKPMSRGSK